MKSVIGRPMKNESVVEEMLMEIQATAMDAFSKVPTGNEGLDLRNMFKRIVRAAYYAQSANQGLRTPSGHFNEHLLELMREENLC